MATENHMKDGLWKKGDRHLGPQQGIGNHQLPTEPVLVFQQAAKTAPKIVVVGSINMDLVAWMSKLPRPGETVTGESFQTIPGGKGANQAVAAARLGARVSMIGRLGDDAFGANLRQSLLSEGIDASRVFNTPECSSGVALIGVETAGANAITVIPAANGRLTIADIESCHELIATSDALIVQLETPISTVAAAIQIARQFKVLTVLDPAPAPQGMLPAGLLSVDILSPNQTEAEALTGIVVSDWSSAEAAAKELQRQGANDVVIKMGSLGALICEKSGSCERVNAYDAMSIIDTTAAGDAFTAAMTVARCEEHSLTESAKFGCIAGTLACTKFGAQPAMPNREEVNRWYSKGKE